VPGVDSPPAARNEASPVTKAPPPILALNRVVFAYMLSEAFHHLFASHVLLAASMLFKRYFPRWRHLKDGPTEVSCNVNDVLYFGYPFRLGSCSRVIVFGEPGVLA
jgi:hypothetical protein